MKKKLDLDESIKKNQPEGIGGWLLLPAIGIIFDFIVIIGEIGQFIQIKEKDISHNVIQFGIWSNVLIGIFLVILSVFFFGKRKQSPDLFIFYLYVIVIINFLRLFLFRIQLYDVSDELVFVRSIIIAGIWRWYFTSSKRVYNTFVN